MSPHEQLVVRIREEYREMPGLRLTFAQACRLWQIDPDECELVLDALLEEQFLARTADGAFVALPTAGARAVPIKAALRPAVTHVAVRRRA